jgi:hypothetical protein
MRCRIIANLMFLTVPASLFGQSAGGISALEGRKVRLKIDMPATISGVDVSARRKPGVNLSELNNRLTVFGTAIRNGQASTITSIKDTGRTIEVELDGGGAPPAGSEHVCVAEDLRRRERDLEEQRSITRNNQQVANLDLELRNVRSEMNAVQSDCTSRKLAVSSRAGSRFRIHYGPKFKAQGITAELLESILADYMDISPAVARVQ